MITRNFSRTEFACRCGCGRADPHPALVIQLQRLRDMLQAPITVTSGSRCDCHNRAVGGAVHSYHLTRPDYDGYTLAADCAFGEVSLREVYDLVTCMGWFESGGVGVYVDEDGPRLHLDVRRDGPKRWGYIDGKLVSAEMALAEDDRRRRPPEQGGST